MADVATTAVASAAAPSTPVVKKNAPRKGRQAAAVAAAKISTPKSPAAKTAKSATVAKPKIPKAKTPSDHPTYLLMVTEALSILKDRKGASSQAIFKHISEQYNLAKDGTSHKTIRNRFKSALTKGVSTGVIDQTSGTGAAGRFRIPVKPKKTASDSAPTTPSTPVKSKQTIKKVAKSAPSPAEKKSSPKKVAKPVAKKGKKTSTVAKMMVRS